MRNHHVFRPLSGLVGFCLLCGVWGAVSACTTSSSTVQATPGKPYQETRKRLYEQCSNYREQTRQKAEAGDAQAQAALGYCYMDVRNDREAEVWFRRSAEQGNADGQYMLGFCYAEKGCALNKGLPHDEAQKLAETEGLKWDRKAADRNHADAQYSMGLSYKYGLEKAGLSPSEKKAKEWFRKAAAQGHPRAKEELE